MADSVRKKIEILFFDAGGGHRSTAEAIREEILNEGRPWDVALINVNDILGGTDPMRRLTGKRSEEIYNLLYQHEWTLGIGFLLLLTQFVLRLLRPAHIRLLCRHWQATKPDMVVSVTPNFNRAFSEAVCIALPGVPFIVLPTDYADIPPHGFYFDEIDCYAICSTKLLTEQAGPAGIPKDKIFRISGPVVNPRFYAPANIDRRAELERLGLEPDRPTGLVIFGSYGSEAMLSVQDSMSRDCPKVQLIFICGKNQALVTKLRSHSSKTPKYVEGFTKEIPYFMSLADFYIGKTGGLILSEAVVKNLPVITVLNSKTMIQELPNIAWVRDNQIGVVLPSYRETGRVIAALFASGEYAELKQRVAAVRNRGIFEVLDILEKILNP